MWQTDTLMPAFSNREDYLLTLSVFDDDTLLPVDLSGITLNNTGIPFTQAVWTVVDGDISTSSTTSITIPIFPVTKDNNLTQLALVVGTGLGIVEGDAIKITDTQTLTNSLNGFCVSYDSATGALVVQVGWTFQFEVRRGGPRNAVGYTPGFDWGVAGLGPLLSANFANGYLSLIDANVVQILIPEKIVRGIGWRSDFGRGDAPGTYKVGMTGTDSANTRQFLIGSQPFLCGGVTN